MQLYLTQILFADTRSNLYTYFEILNGKNPLSSFLKYLIYIGKITVLLSVSGIRFLTFALYKSFILCMYETSLDRTVD